MKIDFKAVDLSKQKIQEDLGCFIEFYPTHFIYRLNFWADEPTNEQDEKLGTDTVKNDFTTIVLKSSIGYFEKIFTDSGLWKVQIGVFGAAGGVKVYFEREKEADTLLKQLLKYTTNNVEPV